MQKPTIRVGLGNLGNTQYIVIVGSLGSINNIKNFQLFIDKASRRICKMLVSCLRPPRRNVESLFLHNSRDFLEASTAEIETHYNNRKAPNRFHYWLGGLERA